MDKGVVARQLRNAPPVIFVPTSRTKRRSCTGGNNRGSRNDTSVVLNTRNWWTTWRERSQRRSILPPSSPSTSDGQNPAYSLGSMSNRVPTVAPRLPVRQATNVPPLFAR